MFLGAGLNALALGGLELTGAKNPPPRMVLLKGVEEERDLILIG